MQEKRTNLSNFTGGELLRFAVAYTGAEPRQWDHHMSFLKHLRRLGVPDVEGLRRGPAAQYRWADLFQVAVALELTESGMTALAASIVIRDSRRAGLSEAPDRVRAAIAAGSGDSLLLILSRTSFDGFDYSPTREAWAFLGDMPAFDGKARNVCIQWASEFKNADFFTPGLEAPSSYGRQRRTVINLSQVVQAVDGLAANVEALNAMPEPSPDERSRERYRR
jgi:hypothetical protein